MSWIPRNTGIHRGQKNKTLISKVLFFIQPFMLGERGVSQIISSLGKTESDLGNYLDLFSFANPQEFDVLN